MSMWQRLVWELEDLGPALLLGLIVAIGVGFLAYTHGYNTGYQVRSAECSNNGCSMGPLGR